MSSTRSKKKQRARTQRLTSNVFAMFNQAQIQEFKEAFNMIDQNRDGYVDKEDLLDTLTSLGKNPTDDELDLMINMAPGPINFTMFLTLFGEKLNGTDPEDVIKNAFACFDDKNLGFIGEDYLKECLMTMGDRWSEDMVEDLFHGAPIQEGRFDYVEFTRTLKHGAREKDEEGAAGEGQGQGQGQGQVQGQGQQGQQEQKSQDKGQGQGKGQTPGQVKGQVQGQKATPAAAPATTPALKSVKSK